ncbi:indolepyruvate ferredoxin oxidoreductase subunit alpha [Deferribacter autotrophicus]|uniref:Indolepyruvate oxidoreductase subunit IorA n=1 Tax=Deferribacter autotrophicus TaxID=500465 RepID=A0A5A8F7V6_9BACT|nr:indolepyruvate ferredoxin oxidoreductase subunit alpha [Deferribacter autotrophicus]KAA0258058.1 indolepyruvate ferredoxin oxidoreductase subunit alpha [Deferribacter autotrophicus]
MKRVLSGNEAFARGAFEAAVKVVSSYPGTPSTEITENIKFYDEIYSEWAPNEKVAFEVALGASLAGKRALTCMKHVGLNVAADPLMTASYTGVNGGMVVIVADDPNMYSSQNEQDSRHYARFAKVPMLEPSDSQEAKDYLIEAFKISEEFCTPVLVRSCTRLSHSKTVVELGERCAEVDLGLENNIPKWVMVPANARKRHIVVEDRLKKLTDFSYSSNLNKIEYKSKNIGIVCSGIVYQYVKEALPDASILKLGMVYPISIDLVKEFSEKVDKLYVVEELDKFIENELKAAGIKVESLNRDVCGELSVEKVRELFGEETVAKEVSQLSLPNRPPNMCPGCSHRGIFYAINRLKLFVVGDIGCYTLGLLPPLSAINSTVCMGASVSMTHGIDKASDGEYTKKVVGVIGDSTFLHTGVNGLMNIIYNKGFSTIIILDNRITGMTGHQPNPATGFTIKGEPAPKIDFEVLVRAMGVKNVYKVDPFNIEECMEVLKREVEKKEPSVIITTRPCIFADRSVISSPFYVDVEKCTGCKACTKIGCPAILWDENKRQAYIDETLCTGCGLCPKVCRFDAIHQRGEK